jgi:membrane protein
MIRFWRILKRAAIEFIADHGMKLSASLSYYTIFAVGPLLIIITSLAGLFYGRDAVEGRVYYQINDLVGSTVAKQVQDIIQNIEEMQLSHSGAALGIAILLVVATGVFAEIQDSINYIWSVKAKPKKGWLHLIMNRLISFLLILTVGVMLLVSLIVHTLVDLLYGKLIQYFDVVSIYIFQAVNYGILVLIITTFFAIIFKVLPDASIHWKDAFIGAAFTAVLFIIGRFAIGFYLSRSIVSVTFGTAASIILILLWVYYCSIILFFGAEFTKVYALSYGSGIAPDKSAVFIVKREAKELDFEKIQ